MMMQETVKNRELVSALADGRLRGEEFASTVEWIEQAEDARLTWHAYHVVSDVLRSGDAMVGGRDAAFLARLKLGLQQEIAQVSNAGAINSIAFDVMPTVTPGVNSSKFVGANDAVFRWKVLAGVASLALVSVIGWQVSSGWGDQHGAPQLAQGLEQGSKSALALQQAPTVIGGEPQVMIRDPQLDALLAAHQQFGGTSALQMPAGFLRNATFEGAAR
jgi:sigma-E factor negative regulatory protein RseA